MTRWIRVGVLLLLIVFVGGCNIFESLAPSESASDYISDGRDALREGDYDAAIEAFDKALEEDPSDARAHWGLAKAWVRQSGYTSISIMTELSMFQESNFGVSVLPFQQDPAYMVNELYVGLQHANEHLKAIHDGVAVSEELNRSEIALDYTGTLAVQGLLLFRDTNGDGLINDQDFSLTAFYQDGEFTLDPNAWAQMTPEEQQQVLNNVGDILTESSDVLLGMFQDLLGDESLGVDTDNLDQVIDDLLNGLGQNYGWTGGTTL